MLQRPSDRKVAGANGGKVEPCDLALQVPTLYEYLTQCSWPDGTERQTSGLLVFHQDGMLKGMLRDKDSGLCLWIAGKSLTAMLVALEAALLDPEAEWRLDRPPAGGQAKRVKR